MRIAVIAGLIHSFLPVAQRQMNLNDNQPFPHPAIDSLGESLDKARERAAKQPRPTPTPCNAIFVGGRWFEQSAV